MSKKTKTVQQVLPFKEFTEKSLVLQNGTVTRLLHVAPISTKLFSDDEWLKLFMGFQGFLSGINSDYFEIFISTERVNLDRYIVNLESKMDELMYEFQIERLDNEIEYLKKDGSQSPDRKFYISVRSKRSKIELAEEDLDSIVENVSLIAGDFKSKVTPVPPNKYAQILYEKLNPQVSKNQQEISDTSIDSITPSSIRVVNDSVYEIDGEFFRYFTVINFPREGKKVWADKLYAINGNVDIHMSFVKTDKLKVQKSISTSANLSEAKTFERMARYLRMKYEKQVKDADTMLQEIGEDNQDVFYITYIITIHAENLNELNKLTRKVETAMHSCKMSSRRLTNEGLDAIWASLPICYDVSTRKGWYRPEPLRMRYSRNMHTKTASSLFPFSSETIQMDSGVRKGFNPDTKSLIIIDRFRPDLPNPNEVVLGQSGTGKSFYIEADALRHNSQGVKIVMIDPERAIKIKFGERIKFSANSNFCTNPYHIHSTVIDSDNDSIDGQVDVGGYLRLKVDRLKGFYKRIYPEITTRQLAKLDSYTIQIYVEKGYTFDSTKLPDVFPTLTDLLVAIKEDPLFEDFIDILGEYVTGTYSKVFNGQTNWSMNHSFTVLDVFELSEHLKPVIMEVLSHELWEIIKKDRFEKFGFYLDEAYLMIDPERSPQTLTFFFHLAKRIRKYSGYFIPVTQNIADFLKGDAQQILNNCYFHTYFQMRENDVAKLSETTTLSEEEKKFLRSNQPRGRCLFSMGSQRVRMQTRATIDEMQFLDPKKHEEMVIGKTS